MSKTTLPTYDQALAQILEHAPTLAAEQATLDDALGRMLLEDMTADRDQPPFDRSAMDGFAVRAREVKRGRSFPVKGSVAAGGASASFQTPMPDVAVLRIATGAPAPAGADAVVPIERCRVEGDGDDEQVTFEVDDVEPWDNIHRRATDASAGQTVLRSGTRLAAHHIGIAAAVGAVALRVTQRPRVSLITTGDEVLDCKTPTDALGPQQIRNSNGPMLAALLRTLGVGLLHHEHVPDDPEQTLCAAREALSRSHLVLTVGGVSVGQRDFLPGAWRHLGLATILHGIAIQPGKPVLACRWEEPDGNKLVLGLPGNPVSVLATAHLFVRPVLRAMLTAGRDAALPWRSVRLVESVKAKANRLVFRAAKLLDGDRAQVIQWHGSGDLAHTAEADGFVRLPLTDDPVAAGTEVLYLSIV